MREIIKLKRYSDEAIFKPDEKNEWESSAVFNAGIVEHDSKIHMLYRATDKNSNGRECADYLNYIGKAVSTDGIKFKRENQPLLSPVKNTYENRGCEDPRVIKIDDTFYMTYTGFGGRYDGDFRICLATSKDLIKWNKKGVLLDEENKDAALFPELINGRYALIHRRAPHIWIGYSDDLENWTDHKVIAETSGKNEWENSKIGLAGPPIKTDKGWILIYHGVSKKTKSIENRGEYQQYSLGLMLLDKEDPSKIIYRQKEPILEPELDWEVEDGFVPNVVFSCGHVIRDGKLYVYYGGADTKIGLATCKMDDILDIFDKVGK